MRVFFPLLVIGVVSLAACDRDGVAWPLSDAQDRPTPLSFGLYVTPDPKQNPIDPPERFIGYHAGLDFELFPGEEDATIPVYALCAGPVLYSGYAEGYGGLLVQRCTLARQPVTVLYGHLLRSSLPPERTRLPQGATIGYLAPAHSEDSGGNRKHLHLGIHRGRYLDFRGYVQRAEELQEYLDPLTLLNGGPDAVSP